LSSKNVGKVVMWLLSSAEVFWRIFEKTGSITAYIIYRRLIVQ